MKKTYPLYKLNYIYKLFCFNTYIIVKRIDSVEEIVDFLKDLENKFKIKQSPISESLFGRKKITNEINLLIDFEKRNDYVKLLTQIKRLNIQKLKFLFFFISLVNNLKSIYVKNIYIYIQYVSELT